MNPFVLAGQIRQTQLDYLKTTFRLSDRDFERRLFAFLEGPQGMFAGPYVDVRLPFRQSIAGSAMPLEIEPGFRPYAHQARSFDRLHSRDGHRPQSTLVVTGTGSGKTECFLYPILDHCYRTRGQAGIKAILLYPMNALASDQARRLARTLWDDERLKGSVSAGLYVGGQGTHPKADRLHLTDVRAELRRRPPNILLTNYRMLDFLLLRPEDSDLWRYNQIDTLQYLVLDELHTYDGAQGSDVACLVRRLKARMGMTRGTLCAVGTSATIHSSGAIGPGGEQLCRFAETVFQEEFTSEALVREDRLTLEETLGTPRDPFPLPISPGQPEDYESAEAYLARQVELWLGEADLGAVAVGERLLGHPFLHHFMRVVGGKLLRMDELAQEVSRFLPDFSELDPGKQGSLLLSLLTLISFARRMGADGREQPFLTCLAQLWTRELRRLTYDCEDDSFHWEEEDPGRATPRFPLLYCGECGAHLIAGLQLEGQDRLQRDLRQIGQAFQDHRLDCRALQFLGEPLTEDPQYFCPACLRLGVSVQCACGSGPARPVRISLDRREDRKFYSHRCPECESANALFFLASRGTTLNSVALHHLFNSDFNQDRKALAFTDSVQDASHLAGFVGSRTYRFSLRSAIQETVQKALPGTTLHDLPERVWQCCLERWGPAKALITLWPPDLQGDSGFQSFCEAPIDSGPRIEGLKPRLLQRLGWEITSEFGFTSMVGRSLEKCACSLVYPNEDGLGRAARQLQLELKNQLTVPGADDLSAGQIHHFLLGLIFRLRTRGGVLHDYLQKYLQQDGKDYLLRKAINPMMAPLSSERMPVFLTDLPSDRFDWFGAPPRRLTWYRDWAARSLGLQRDDQGIRDLYALALAQLSRSGLLDDRAGKQGRVYGLRPQGLRVTADLVRLECAHCGHPLHVAESQFHLWENSSCLHFRCPGRFREVAVLESYYASLYRRATMERIFADEHTGLLQRKEREQLEDRFKASDRPGAPNLLFCTPTLEMGVDVGDLSAVLACTVPPATANYLQRMGRAGRLTGNALGLTTAETRPHDLYFFNQPLEMMRGEVLPPGCFLDAPEMLRRQLVAYCMDQWARQEKNLTLQNRVLPYLTAAGQREFPGRFLDFYRRQRKELLEGFLGLFPDLGPEPVVHLRSFGESDALCEKVEDAFQSLALERDQLIKLRNHCKKAIELLKGQEEALKTAETERELKDLESSRMVLYRLIEELAQKYPLNVLTDAGVLPNYAFPEPGVTLKTVIRRGHGDDGKPGYDSRELMRPASAALRELAPHNHFYSHGQVVAINQVDLGTRQRPLMEEWRLCPACAYSTRSETPEASSSLCPACGNDGWSDTGQLQVLLKMRHVSALADLLSSRTTDYREERERTKYQMVDLIAVSPVNYANQCFQLPALPFGFELLRNLTLRQINFGPSGEGPKVPVCGQRVSLLHFTTCKECGRVANPDNSQLDHAPYCRQRKNREARTEDTVNLALYREMNSEAIRLLLPAASLEVDEQMASFKAALMLGLRRHFQGNPLHLSMRKQSEPIEGNPMARRHFLVLYDTVPGGTGYLAALSQPEGMRQVLGKALAALMSCTCNMDPNQDGCYRCLFAFQQQFDLPLLSRRRATKILQQILERWDGLERGLTLSEISLDDRLESELEHRFLARLLEEVDKIPGGRHHATVYGGCLCHQLQLSQQRRWLVIPQLELGYCRPDFVLRPDWGAQGERPVAVFCDGKEFHVCPGKLTSRLADDIGKRSRILNEEKHWIWNVTWADLDPKAPCLMNLLNWLSGLESQEDQPTWKAQQERAFRQAKLFLEQKSSWQYAPASALQECRQYLIRETNPFAGMLAREPNPDLLGHLAELAPFASAGFLWEPNGAKVPTLDSIQLLMRLYDNPEERANEKFPICWQWFLTQWNQFQFLPWHRAISTSQIHEDPEYVEWVAETPPPYVVAPSPPSPWDSLRELAHPRAYPILEALQRAGAPLPEVGYEVGDGHRVLGEVELAWPNLHLGLVLTEEDQFPGWRIAVLEEFAQLIQLFTIGEVALG